MMKTIAIGSFVLLAAAAAARGDEPNAPALSPEVEVSGVIVDGLDRPIAGAAVTFACVFESKDTILGTFTTDDTGRYAGIIHGWPESEKAQVYLSAQKSGYLGGATPAGISCRNEAGRLRDSRFAIWRRIFFEEAAENLDTLTNDGLDQYVLEILASNLWTFGQPHGAMPDIEDVLFERQRRLLPALRRACKNPRVGQNARRFLEFLGELRDPDELKLIKDAHRSTPKKGVSAHSLSDAVRAVAETYALIRQSKHDTETNPFSWAESQELVIDRTVFTDNCHTVLVRCHVHCLDGPHEGYRLRFERIGDNWVLKAILLEWIT